MAALAPPALIFGPESPLQAWTEGFCRVVSHRCRLPLNAVLQALS